MGGKDSRREIEGIALVKLRKQHQVDERILHWVELQRIHSWHLPPIRSIVGR